MGVQLRNSELFTLADLTLRAAAEWPDQPAVYDGYEHLTFRELHRAAECLAAELVGLGVRPGDCIALFAEKRVWSVVAMFASFKARAISVPLDPKLPEGRLSFELHDADPRLVLGPSELQTKAAGLPYLALDRMQREPAAPSTPLPRVRADDVAYMMYTSGSTGYPKGVLIEHGSVGAFFDAHNARARIRPGDRCMNTGPFHFDVCMIDVFLPLSRGASVILTPPLPAASTLLATIERYRVTHFYAVGTVLGALTGNGEALDRVTLSSLRVLQTGAEVCNPEVVNHWLKRVPGLTFVNSYGPTELTVGCSCFCQTDGRPLPETDVPIGTLHERSSALLAQDDGCFIDPRGESGVGELLVSGAQLMRGYWKRPAEERAAFVEVDGRRFYRTGDLVRASGSGVLHYIGRRDDQLKVDGVRIHLNEVKRCLEHHPLVASASAFVVTTGPSRRVAVAAAVVPWKPLAMGEPERILAEAGNLLPTPAVPTALLVCNELPRMSTGKVDTRRACEVLEPALAQTGVNLFRLERNGTCSPLLSAETQPRARGRSAPSGARAKKRSNTSVRALGRKEHDSQVEQRLRAIIARLFPPCAERDALPLHVPLHQLGIHSLIKAALFVELEVEFGLTLEQLQSALDPACSLSSLIALCVEARPRAPERRQER